MQKKRSIKVKLMSAFLFASFIPLFAVVTILIAYVGERTETITRTSTEGTLAILGHSTELYLSELENMTLIPYMNQKVMNALIKKKKYIQSELEQKEQYEINYALTYELPVYFQLMRQEISDLLILPMDGSVYLMSENLNQYVRSYDFTSLDWYQAAIEADGGTVFIGNHEQDYLIGNKKEGVFSVARLIKDLDSKDALAVVIADTKTEILEGLIQSIPLSENSFCMIVDSEYQVVCANRTPENSILKTMAETAAWEKTDNEEYLVVTEELETAQWKIVALIPKNELLVQRKVLVMTGVLVSLIYLMGGAVLFWMLSKYVTNPLVRLSTVVKKMEAGNFPIMYQVESRDEIGELGNHFNRMSNRIALLIDQECKAAVLQKEMEYRAMQSQINPHFVYNVLNTFVGLNRAGKREQLEKSIWALTKIFRYIVNKQGKVTLGVELDIVEKYCELQKLRFENRLEYLITCEAEYLQCIVPKLLLQPIVENAVLHGIEPKPEGGMVVLFGETAERDEEEGLLITIEDNGVGFDAAECEEGNSVGLSNVKERLLHVSPHAVFAVESRKGEGTVIKIWIPGKELQYENTDCG